MISTRYAIPVLALFVLALVPTVIHNYVGLTVPDARSTTLIPNELAGYLGEPSGRNETWGQRRFDSFDWAERTYVSGLDEVTLTVVRSYDLKTLYHHPELATTEDTFSGYGVERWPGSDRPVHTLRSGQINGPAAAYALHYGDEFVERPVLFQLRTSGELLVSGRKAMTLIFVRDGASPQDDLAATGLARVLQGAIDAFLSQQP